MKLHHLLWSAAIIAPAAVAQTSEPAAPETPAAVTQLEDIIVTANPLRRSADDLVQPVDVIAGSELDRKRKATIGETLEGELGISSADFGPGVGRPVIRGQGGARVLVMENGFPAGQALRGNPAAGRRQRRQPALAREA